MKRLIYRYIFLFIYIILASVAPAVSKTAEAVEPWSGNMEPFDAGNGSAGNPYRIETPEHLAFLAYATRTAMRDPGGFPYANASYILVNNLDLAGREWLPIGAQFNNSSLDPANEFPFKGNFDGNGKTISGLVIETPWRSSGLFGYINEGSVSRLGIIRPDVRNAFWGGALSGITSHATVTNSYSAGGSVSGNRVGGLFGNIYLRSVISSCYSTTDVRGDVYTGGLVGWVALDSNPQYGMRDCYATGKVVGTDGKAGGLAGLVLKYGTVSRSYAYGDLSDSGAPYIGGVAAEVVSPDVDITLIRYSAWYRNGEINASVSSGVGPISGDSIHWREMSSMDVTQINSFLEQGWDFDIAGNDRSKIWCYTPLDNSRPRLRAFFGATTDQVDPDMVGVSPSSLLLGTGDTRRIELIPLDFAPSITAISSGTPQSDVSITWNRGTITLRTSDVTRDSTAQYTIAYSINGIAQVPVGFVLAVTSGDIRPTPNPDPSPNPGPVPDPIPGPSPTPNPAPLQSPDIIIEPPVSPLVQGTYVDLNIRVYPYPQTASLANVTVTPPAEWSNSGLSYKVAGNNILITGFAEKIGGYSLIVSANVDSAHVSRPMSLIVLSAEPAEATPTPTDPRLWQYSLIPIQGHGIHTWISTTWTPETAYRNVFVHSSGLNNPEILITDEDGRIIQKGDVDDSLSEVSPGEPGSEFLVIMGHTASREDALDAQITSITYNGPHGKSYIQHFYPPMRVGDMTEYTSSPSERNSRHGCDATGSAGMLAAAGVILFFLLKRQA